MTQKTRIAILAPMLALALVGALLTLTPEIEAQQLEFYESSEVTFEQCVSTAGQICGEAGVSSLNYDGGDGSCSFTCNPPAV